MFDNFGLGELFFLAILGLLFFGPDRLPGMGAKLGRWIANMTQYSKAFMTQWQEEAAVVQEAVDEVKGIRDEIRAARQEIASTVNTARRDVEGGLTDAQKALSEAKSEVTQRVDESRQRTAADLAGRKESGEARAAARTEEILDKALAGRSTAPDSEPKSETPEAIDGDQERAKMLRDVREKLETHAASEESPESPQTKGAQASFATSAVAAPRTRKKGEDAFSKTQKILATLQAKRDGVELETPAEDAEESKVRASQAVAPPARVTEPKTVPAVEVEERRAETVVPAPVVEPQAFEKLNSQVARLEDEIQALRAELQALRTERTSPAGPAKVEETEQATPTEPTTEDSEATVSLEEPA